MNAEEFVLIPKKNYLKERPIADQILQDPQVKEKALQLSLLQRVEAKEHLNADVPVIPETLKETIFAQLSALSHSERQKSEYIYDAIINSTKLSIDSSGGLLIDNIHTGLQVGTFLYDLQRTKKIINRERYRAVIDLLGIPEHMVTNTYAKQIINEKTASKGTTSPPKEHISPFTPRKTTLRPSPSSGRSQWGRGKKRRASKHWTTF